MGVAVSRLTSKVKVPLRYQVEAILPVPLPVCRARGSVVLATQVYSTDSASQMWRKRGCFASRWRWENPSVRRRHATALRIGVGSNEGSGGGDNQIDFEVPEAVPSALVALMVTWAGVTVAGAVVESKRWKYFRKGRSKD